MINESKVMFSVTHISWGLPLYLVHALLTQYKILRDFNLHYAAATTRWDSRCLCHFEFKESLSLNTFGAVCLNAEITGNSNSHILDCKKPRYMNQNDWRVA